MSAAKALIFDPCNEVHLIGRVVRDPEVIVLPSGDELVKAKITVPRPRPPAGRGLRANPDQVVCAAWELSLRRSVRVWCKGDVVEVKGALRSRVWRRDGGVQILYEIELAEVATLQATAVPTRPGNGNVERLLGELFPAISPGPGEVNSSSA